MTRRLPLAVFMCSALGVWLSAGCTPYERVVRDDWAVFADNARAGGAAVTVGGQRERGGGAQTHRRREGMWTVYLVGHEGDDRVHQAFADATWLRGQAGLPEVWFADVDGVAGVHVGRFRKPDDRRATRLVEQLRQLERNDETPYADARIIQVLGATADAATSPLDLRSYRGRFQFSLQIGFFDAAYPKDRRDAAEAWVREVRAAHPGVEAFYYHGPNRSLVTVGLFNRKDFVRKGFEDAYGPRILGLQKQFPHNVGNGMTLMERNGDGTEIGEQPSFLVRIPR